MGGSQAYNKAFKELLPTVFKRIKNSDIPIKIYQQCQKDQTINDFYNKNNIEYELFNFTEI